MFHNGEWGTICDDSWDALDAAVVCSSLGFVGRSEAYSDAYFGEGTGTILLDDVNCGDHDATLLQCPKSDWGSHNCGHYEDAGVICGITNESGIRLQD